MWINRDLPVRKILSNFELSRQFNTPEIVLSAISVGLRNIGEYGFSTFGLTGSHLYMYICISIRFCCRLWHTQHQSSINLYNVFIYTVCFLLGGREKMCLMYLTSRFRVKPDAILSQPTQTPTEYQTRHISKPPAASGGSLTLISCLITFA